MSQHPHACFRASPGLLLEKGAPGSAEDAGRARFSCTGLSAPEKSARLSPTRSFDAAAAAAAAAAARCAASEGDPGRAMLARKAGSSVSWDRPSCQDHAGLSVVSEPVRATTAVVPHDLITAEIFGQLLRLLCKPLKWFAFQNDFLCCLISGRIRNCSAQGHTDLVT